MRDQRIKARAPLRGIEPRNRLAIRCVRAEPVDRLGGKRDKPAVGEHARGRRDRIAVRFHHARDQFDSHGAFRYGERGTLASKPEASRVTPMTYRAPVSDIAFTLKHSAGLKQAIAEGLYGDLSEDVVEAVLEEAGKFASTVIAPLNKVGDRQGTPFKDGAVTMPPGWKEAYTAWAQGGWNGLAASEHWGGQGLPHALNSACLEMWNSASMAFGIGPVLTM